MAYDERGTHDFGASVSCYSKEDFTDDPLLPQKALPLPDDLEDHLILQNGPADVVAAAASALAACESLPDGEAAVDLMQPLAEAYLLAVRKEAQSLPKVVSAVSGERKVRQCRKSETSASSGTTSVLNTVGPCVSRGSGFTHIVHSPDSPQEANSKAQITTSESCVSTATQMVATSSAEKLSRVSKKASPSQDSIGISSDGEDAENISWSVVASPYSPSSDETSNSETEEIEESSRRCEAVSVPQFLIALRDSKGRSTSKDTESRTERGRAADTPSKERTYNCCASNVAASAQKPNTLRSWRRRSNEDTKIAAVLDGEKDQELVTAAWVDEGGEQHNSRLAETTCQQVQEVILDTVKDSDVQISPHVNGAKADSICDASRLGVGTSGGSLSPGKAEEEGLAAFAGIQVATVDSRTAASCLSRNMEETGKASKGSRQKVGASYVDRLVLLDRQREAASASAAAPAAAWRDAALRQFKRLRSYVNSDRFTLADDQQLKVGIGCPVSWSEQEWQLYCRCYPPSLRLLGACDTVTLCKLLFMFGEDLKLQQRAIAKTERKRNSGNANPSSCPGGSGLPDALSKTCPQQHKRTRESKQADERECTSDQSQTQQQRCVDARDGDQDTGCRHTPGDKQHDSAEEDHAPSTHTNDKDDGENLAEERTTMANKNVHAPESGLEDGQCQKIEERVAVNAIFSEGACKCCRHRDCCVTLQQACWLFGIFVFLDELQAMDADVASCIQEIRRICENAREQASCHRIGVQPYHPSARRAAEPSRNTPERKKGDTLSAEDGKEIVAWVPTDLVASLNLLIVIINDFFNQR